MQDLDFENFSIWHLEESFKLLMDKLQFKLADKLIVPVTYFVISNFVASSIEILDDTIKLENSGFPTHSIASTNKRGNSTTHGIGATTKTPK